MQLILSRACFVALMVWFGICLIGSPAALAQDRCTIAFDACLDDADTSFAACYERCESDTCFTRCDGRYDRALAKCDNTQTSCEVGGSSSRSSAASPARPALAQGNGCYLGECPDDEPVSSPSPGISQPQGGQPLQSSWVCQTPAYWCVTGNGAWPVGSSCWCSNPMFGTAIGQIVPQQ